MSNLFKVFSMENQECDVVSIDATNVESVVDASAATDAAESVDAELKNIDQAISSATDAAEGLEEVQGFVEEKASNGGLTDSEAKLVTISAEALLSRFEGNIKIKMHSYESFSGADRMKNTCYTVESFGETLKSMWEAIKRWVSKWIEKTQDWFREHLSQAGRMKKAAAALIEKLSKKTGEADKDAFEMSVGERRFLVKSGKQDTPKVSDLTEIAGKFYDDADKTIKQVKDENKAFIDSIAKIDINNVITTPIEAIISVRKNIASLKTSMKNKDVYLGGYHKDLYVFGSGMGDSLRDTDSIYGAQFVLAEDENSGPWEGDLNVKVLNKEDIMKALGAVQGICDIIMKKQKTYKQEKADVDKSKEEVEKIISKIKGDVKSQTVKELQKHVKNIGKLLPVTLKMETDMVRFFTNVARNWLSYCNRCTSNIVEKKA